LPMTGMARQREAFPHADACMRRLLAAASLPRVAPLSPPVGTRRRSRQGAAAETRGIAAQAARDAMAAQVAGRANPGGAGSPVQPAPAAIDDPRPPAAAARAPTNDLALPVLQRSWTSHACAA
jgi:hypothetical protein